MKIKFCERGGGVCLGGGSAPQMALSAQVIRAADE